MSALDSAIDDTFGIPRLSSQSEHHDDDNLFDGAYVGPRDGHWEVTSSVGSFVDDRCPTVYGYRHKPRGNGYGYGTQMDEGLAKRLVQATIQEKRATAVSAAKDATSRAEVYDETQHSLTPPRATAPKPKPFVVPPQRHRPHQPVTPDTPKTKKPPATKSSEAKSPPEQHQEATTATRSLSPAGKSVQAATLPSEAKTFAPRNPTSAGHSIRILGKNGEEAYVSLPSLPKTFSEVFSINGRTSTGRPTKRSQQGSLHEAQSQSPEPTAGHRSKASTKHNANKTSNTTANKKQVPEQQGDRVSLPPTISPIPSKGASPMMMSGALPPSSSRGSSKPVSTASSCNDSGIVMGGMSAVVSNVASRKASIRAPGSAISRGVLSVAQEIANMPAASGKKSRSASVASTPSLFEEVGEGVTTGFPGRKKTSVHSKQPAKDPMPGSRPGS